jgi:hypothetical protein
VGVSYIYKKKKCSGKMGNERNIISNSCVGARIYQAKKQEYNNPFMWCLIPPDSFAKLYDNFGKLNLKKYKVAKEGDWYKVVIDEKVDVYYPHYRYDAAADEPRTGGTGELDVYYSKIEEYIKEKYEARLARMSGKPVFVIDDKETGLVGGKCAFSESDLKHYVGKSDCVVCTINEKITGKNVVHKPRGKRLSTGDIAKIILKETGIWK